VAAVADVEVQPVNDAERGWINEHLDLLRAVGIGVRDARQLGAHFDALLSRWLAVPDPRRPDPNPDINLIGLGLGAHLAARTGLEWAVVSDGTGTEIALHGQPGNILIYPTNAVAKRWIEQEIGFLPDFADRTVQAVAHIQTAHRIDS
jgi:hypothetical protein